jgi:hypothetical protein
MEVIPTSAAALVALNVGHLKLVRFAQRDRHAPIPQGLDTDVRSWHVLAVLGSATSGWLFVG